MDEPLKKKLRIEGYNVKVELSQIEEHLLNNCLCALPDIVLQKFYSIWSSLSSDSSRDEILMLVSSVQLVCEVAIRQYSSHIVCAGIHGVCNTFAQNENLLVHDFLKLSNNTDQFISFAASRALSLLLLVVKIYNNHLDGIADDDQRSLDLVTENLVKSKEPDRLSFSLDVLKRLMEWKSFDQHSLEDTVHTVDSPVHGCNALTVGSEPEEYVEQMKCLCITSLKCQWAEIVRKFVNLAQENSPRYHYSIITFLNLWEAIISIKANLSVKDTQPFYWNYEQIVSLLSKNTPVIIWKSILNLLNEILCYGTTLALQNTLDQEPCLLGALIVKKVNERKINRKVNEDGCNLPVNQEDHGLLGDVPYGEDDAFFGGGNGKGDKVLVQKVVLLILKAVAVMVKETRYDSSSDSSFDSDVEDTDGDMAIIEGKITEALKRLDKFVKKRYSFHPQTPLAQWVVKITCDQDDYMIESMVCCLDIVIGLYYKDDALGNLGWLNPNITFLNFIQAVSFDSNQLLDFLISNETCFLLYILKYLKYICRNCQGFVDTSGDQIGKVRDVFLNLHKSINDLQTKNLFPYNIDPVLEYLGKVNYFLSNNISNICV